MQRTMKVVTNAVTAASRQMLHSSLKAMRRHKNQGSDATVQQGNAPTTASAPSASAPDNNNLGANAIQEYGVMDSNASLLSDLGSRAPRFETNTMSQFSPIHSSQTMTHASSAVPPGSQTTVQLILQALFYLGLILALCLG